MLACVYLNSHLITLISVGLLSMILHVTRTRRDRSSIVLNTPILRAILTLPQLLLSKSLWMIQHRDCNELAQTLGVHFAVGMHFAVD
jgi:hypothetical protein